MAVTPRSGNKLGCCAICGDDITEKAKWNYRKFAFNVGKRRGYDYACHNCYEAMLQRAVERLRDAPALKVTQTDILCTTVMPGTYKKRATARLKGKELLWV